MPKLTLTFDPVTQHPQFTCEGWKWSGKNCSLYPAHKVLYKECQSWPWPLTPWPKINRVPPLINPQLTGEVWKWSGKNCRPYRAHKVKCDGRTDASTHSLTHARTHSLIQPLTNGRITISPPTLLRGDKKITTVIWQQVSFKQVTNTRTSIRIRRRGGIMAKLLICI